MKADGAESPTQHEPDLSGIVSQKPDHVWKVPGGSVRPYRSAACRWAPFSIGLPRGLSLGGEGPGTAHVRNIAPGSR